VASQTISVAASGDDGYIIKEASTFGGSDGSFTADLTSAGFTVANRKTGFGGTEEFQRSNFIVRFDTSILPDDAVISAASLEIKSHAFFADDDGRSLQIEWIADPGTIDTGDFSATPAATAKAATALATLAASTLYTWPLLDSAANITVSGYTGLRFHVDGNAPAAHNYIGFYQFDHATEPEPKLIVTYTAASETSHHKQMAMLHVG
jgi:hypothetical protein